jgi:hypothetical protein
LRWRCRHGVSTNSRPAALVASERYEIWLRFPGFVRCYHHKGAAAQTRGVFPCVQGIKQKFLVALHGKLRGLRIWQLAKYRIVARKGAEGDRYAGTARGARRRRCGSKTGQRPGICMKNPAWEGWFHSRPA